ncbi:MAG: PIN domain-containing protein [Saprospiraceae bacterium]
MKIIILDTNIVFSAILNPNNNIGEILFNNDKLEFYTSEYLREEINRHKHRIIELAKTSETDVDEAIFQIYKRINFISDEQIPFNIWYEYASLVRDIDMDDLPYVALTVYLDGLLWTGDLKLLNGLIAKGFDKCIDTKGIIALVDNDTF